MVRPAAPATPAALSVLLAVCSAVLLPLALPNDLYRYGNPFLGAVALAPLLAGLALAPSFRAASAAGALFGAVSTFLAHYWLLFFHEFSVWTVSGVVIGYALYHSLLGPILRGVALRLTGTRPLALAATWTVYEYVKSSGFLGFPWGLIAHPFNMVLPLIQIADTYGVWGVTFVASAVNALAAERILDATRLALPRPRATRLASFGLALVAVAAGYGAWKLARPPAETGRLAVVLVQHDADPWQPGQDEAAVGQAEDLTRRALRAGPADLVVWGETIVPYLVRERQIAAFLQRFPEPTSLAAFLREIRVPLLLGSPFQRTGSSGYENAALLLAPDGRLLGSYGKQQLVPFAERVPLWGLAPVRRFFEDALGLTEGWTPGAGPVVLRLPTAAGEVPLGTPICFEDAFPALCRGLVRAGARVLVNLTNVSWSRRESAMLQMIVAARFRAVEEGCALVRATNGGVTAFVSPGGEIRASLPLFEPGFLRVEVPLYAGAGRTVYARFGDWLPALLFITLVAGLLARLVSERRR
jgi:apolipoprotein N-acyltransferase